MMKKNILIFAGTTEGRQLAEYAVKKGIPCIVSAATEYGEELLENDLQLQKEKHKKSELRVIHGRMDQQEMEAFFEKEQVGLVIDATHPFAVIVTENIQRACKNSGIEYLRCLRDFLTEARAVRSEKFACERTNAITKSDSSVVCVNSVEEAVDYLEQTQGNILITTGSKELDKYTRLTNYKERCYARVLSVLPSVMQSIDLGFSGKHLIAPGFKIVAHTADCPVAAAECTEKNLYAIQFHPEVLHTQEGTKMLHNFVRGVCGCAGTWKMDAFVENTIKEIREKVGSGKVLLALSGGVDSSVAAGLLSRAIGKQLTCVFVDHGLLRKDEGDEVESVFGPEGQFDLNFIRVNAQERYYSKLAGVTEPEAKRKIIGEEFIRVFEEEAKKIGAVDFLAQGTIYPDVVESGLGGESAVIKSHHNVGGLPDFVDFKEIIEPLRDLFKDEVRKAGLELGIPEHLVFRQPFPGPGLGIRIIGEVTGDKVRIVQDADYIYREEVDKAVEAYKKENGKAPAWMPNQYFAALTNMRSVGVMGDERTYDYAVALRAVNTIDFMTAESAEIPFEVLQTVMSRIINEVRGVNRVFYDLTSKPPGTIEFE